MRYSCDHRFGGSDGWCGLAQPVAPGVVAWLKLPRYRDGSTYMRARDWSAHINRLWADMTAPQP
ncbi:hypothetical protein [Tropicimonas sediminicola]|uniref:Uncharacterized protein n=1 Tax=Tropicimonas sediminicola TaxID=1031541 RepID=A0A239J5A1_9RHOB|nr:hypothetical protein [Tropicimonas sediminicola]SNT00969.1 hypothetical protein SAMN05421757_105109 [Tropicimonas sediminicola]